MNLLKIKPTLLLTVLFAFMKTGSAYASSIVYQSQWNLKQSQWQLQSSLVHSEKQIVIPKLQILNDKLVSSLDTFIQNMTLLSLKMNYAKSSKNILSIELNSKQFSQKPHSESHHKLSKPHLDSVWFGGRYFLKKETLLPELHAHLDLALLQTPHSTHNQVFLKHSYLSAIKTSLLASKTLDPLILSCLLSYQVNFKQKTHAYSLKLGNQLYIQPSFYFLVNPSVSLIWGTNLQFNETSYLNYNKFNTSNYHQSVFFGFTYTISAEHALNLSLQWNILSQTQRVFALKHIWTF